jgi:hypothetical protein
MRGKFMALAELWLPLIGAGICISWAIGAWGWENKILATWLTFGGVVCLLLLGTLQWQQIIRNSEAPASEPNETTKLQLRAYVYVLGASLFNFGTEKPITVVVLIKNSGQTPANKMRFRMEGFYASPFPLPAFPEFRTELEGAGVDLGAGGRRFLGPVQLGGTLSPEWAAKVTEGSAAIYVHGEIQYADRFGLEHTTSFRYFFRGNGTPISPTAELSFSLMPEGNSSD